MLEWLKTRKRYPQNIISQIGPKSRFRKWIFRRNRFRTLPAKHIRMSKCWNCNMFLMPNELEEQCPSFLSTIKHKVRPDIIATPIPKFYIQLIDLSQAGWIDAVDAQRWWSAYINSADGSAKVLFREINNMHQDMLAQKAAEQDLVGLAAEVRSLREARKQAHAEIADGDVVRAIESVR